MKSLFTFILPAWLLAAAANAQPNHVQRAFALVEHPAVIEGMAWDNKSGNFYFGENHALKILRYTKAGKPAGFIDAAKAGVVAMLGMTVDSQRHQLWVCGSINQHQQQLACMFQFDLDKGMLIQYYPDSTGTATLFNDVAITEGGDIFTTYPDQKALYKVNREKGRTEPYLSSDSLRDANGITAKGNILFVSTSRGFARINSINRQLQLIQFNSSRIAGNDGLYYYKRSLIGIQNVFFPVMVARYFLNSEETGISKALPLALEHPLFNVPTTGVLVDDCFYFMANTNLFYYDFENRHLTNGEKTEQIQLMKIHLQ